MPIKLSRPVRRLKASATAATARGGGALATLLYRSRAVSNPGDGEITTLVDQARLRNRTIGVTGMLLHETGRFLQWLEGPRESLAALWRSIRADARHDEIRILSQASLPLRLFRGWDMHLIQRSGAAGSTPQTTSSHTRAADGGIAELAGLAIAGNAVELVSAIRGRLPANRELKSLCRDLIEPTCRQLGDWWSEDRCSDVDVTVAMCSLQTASHQLSEVHRAIVKPRIAERRALVAPPPGEAHNLGSMLAGELLRQSGWSVQTEFPRSDAELVEIARCGWFDLLCLSLSDVYERGDRLENVTKTVRTVRLASLNFRLNILVGGRLFRQRPELTAARIGVEAVYSSASDAVDMAELLLSAHDEPHATAVPETGLDLGVHGTSSPPDTLPRGWLWLHRNAN